MANAAVDELAEVKSWLATCRRERRDRKPKPLGTIPVDSGKVEFAFGDSLKRCQAVWERVDNLTLNTARAAFDGRCGAVKTPDGDGDVTVVYCTDFLRKIPAKAQWAGCISVPQRLRPKVNKMVLGDCGAVYLTLPMGHGMTWRLWWVEGRTGPQLWLMR